MKEANGALYDADIGDHRRPQPSSTRLNIPHVRRFRSLKPNVTREKIIGLFTSCAPIAFSNLLTSTVVSVVRQCYGTAFGIEGLGRYAEIAAPAVIIQAAARYLYALVLSPLAKQRNAEEARDSMRRALRFGMNDINFVVIAATVASLICAVLRIRRAGRLAAR